MNKFLLFSVSKKLVWGKTFTSFFSFLFKIDRLLLTEVEFGKSYQSRTFIKMILVCLLVCIKFVIFCKVRENSFILHRNCLLKHVVAGEMEGGLEVMGRQEKTESNYWITLGENKDTGN